MVSTRMSSVSTAVVRSEVDGDAVAYLGLGAATLCWAAAFVAGKFVLAEMTPLSAAAWRYLLAGVVLLPFALRAPSIGSMRGAVLPLMVMMLVGGILYPWLFLSALQRTTATNTALLIALNPVFTVLAAPLVGEPLTRRRLTGVILALGGATVVTTRGDLQVVTALAFNGGDLLAIGAAAMWASFNLSSRAVVARITPATINTLIFCFGGVALLILAAPEGPWAQVRGATPAAMTGLVVMAVFSSVVAGQLFLLGVRALGVSRTVVFIYLIPVITAVLSALILHERFGFAQAVGGAAVLAGVYGASRNAEC
jgi:drug/metabolite transporter (DMT)-like permease